MVFKFSFDEKKKNRKTAVIIILPMIIIIIISAIIATINSTPEFYYQQEVEISNGFYKGQVGIITAKINNAYIIALNNNSENIVSIHYKDIKNYNYTKSLDVDDVVNNSAI